MLAYTAVMMSTLIAFAGFAIDAQRGWMVQTRLKTALDAAVLAAARDFDNPERDANARLAFRANLNPRGGTNVAFGADVSTPTITQLDNNQIRITATATVPKTLFRVVSDSPAQITESSVARRQANGLELALVMDVTGSMGGADDATGLSRIQAAKNAVAVMLDVLYGGQDTQTGLWISVVPFAATVNIGTSTGARSLLNTDAPAMPQGWDMSAWGGCVEARRDGQDLTDSAPTTVQGRFRPFFNPDTYRQFGFVGNPAGPRCSGSTDLKERQAYDPDASGTRWCRGDNDWGLRVTEQLRLNPAYTDRGGFGPNTGCNPSRVLPLTASRQTVQASIDGMLPNGHTVVPIGLHVGWLTLAPSWRGYWPGIGHTSLPLDYTARYSRKVMVMMTDGENNWDTWYPEKSRPPRDAVEPMRSSGELYYSAYGRGRDQRLPFTMMSRSGDSLTQASRALDTRMSAICEAVKASRISLYVIYFGTASNSNRNRMRACASGPDYFFESPSGADLQATFRKIGGRLAYLRLAE